MDEFANRASPTEATAAPFASLQQVTSSRPHVFHSSPNMLLAPAPLPSPPVIASVVLASLGFFVVWWRLRQRAPELQEKRPPEVALPGKPKPKKKKARRPNTKKQLEQAQADESVSSPSNSQINVEPSNSQANSETPKLDGEETSFEGTIDSEVNDGGGWKVVARKPPLIPKKPCVKQSPEEPSQPKRRTETLKQPRNQTSSKPRSNSHREQVMFAPTSPRVSSNHRHSVGGWRPKETPSLRGLDSVEFPRNIAACSTAPFTDQASSQDGNDAVHSNEQSSVVKDDVAPQPAERVTLPSLHVNPNLHVEETIHEEPLPEKTTPAIDTGRWCDMSDSDISESEAPPVPSPPPPPPPAASPGDSWRVRQSEVPNRRKSSYSRGGRNGDRFDRDSCDYQRLKPSRQPHQQHNYQQRNQGPYPSCPNMNDRQSNFNLGHRRISSASDTNVFSLDQLADLRGPAAVREFEQSSQKTESNCSDHVPSFLGSPSTWQHERHTSEWTAVKRKPRRDK